MPIQTSFDPAAMKTKIMHFLMMGLVLRAEALNLHSMLYIKIVKNIVFKKKQLKFHIYGNVRLKRFCPVT